MRKLLHEKKVHIVVIFVAVIFFTAKSLPDVIAQSGSDQPPTPKDVVEDINIDNTYAVKVPDNIVESIKETLESKPDDLFNGKKYALTDINQGESWAVVSIAVIAEDLPPVFEVPFSDTSLIIAYRDTNNIWTTAIKGTQEFESLKNNLPEGILDADESSSSSWWNLVKKVYALGSGDITYLIPWGSNQWDYVDGWHQGCGSCWWGLDVGTDGSDKDVYASAGGTVGICTDNAGSANVYVTDDNHTIRYTHLDSSTLNVSSGNNIETGTLLGTLKTGTFNYDSETGQCITSGTCGCAVQASNYGHMHWVIPTSTEFYVEGWAITYNDDTWASGSKTIDPSGTLFSRPDAMILQNQDLNITRDFSVDNGIEAGPDFTVEASSGNVDFEAGTTIELNPGFTVEDGSQFNASIR